MKDVIVELYRFIFTRKSLYKLNLHIYKLALRGIGVLNSENKKVMGEEYLFDDILKKLKIKTVFDIGASRGNYSKMVRDHFPKAQIYSFEPHPKTFIELNKKRKKLKLKTYKLGFSDKERKSKLWGFSKAEGHENLTLPSIYKDVIRKIHKKEAESFKIQLTTIDKFTKSESIERIDLLKVDTEGSEYEILKGAKNLIRNKKILVIQFEFNEMNVISRVFLLDFIKLLKGYKLFRLVPDGILALEHYDPKIHEIFAFQNIIALSSKAQNYLNITN